MLTRFLLFLNSLLILFKLKAKPYQIERRAVISCKHRFQKKLSQAPLNVQIIAVHLANEFNRLEHSDIEKVTFFSRMHDQLDNQDCFSFLKKQLYDIENAEIRAAKKKQIALTNNRIIRKRLNFFITLIMSVLTFSLSTQLSSKASQIHSTAEAFYFQPPWQEARNISSSEKLLKLIGNHRTRSKTLSETNIVFHTRHFHHLQHEVIISERQRMQRWLMHVHNKPEKLAVFNDPTLHPKTLIIGVIESLLTTTARSPSGAIGIFQIMPGLEGAYGSEDTLQALLEKNKYCLPHFPLSHLIEYREYQKIISSNNSVKLLRFLTEQSSNNNYFWQAFLRQQEAIFTDIKCGQWLAFHYLKDIQSKLHFLPEQQREYLAVMAYNMGLTNSRRLIRALRKQQLEINPINIINFIEGKNLQKHITLLVRQDTAYSRWATAREIKRTMVRMREAKTYLARYIATKQILREHQLALIDFH